MGEALRGRNIAGGPGRFRLMSLPKGGEIKGKQPFRGTSSHDWKEHNAMSVIALFFYLFATITVASAFMVIASRNPVHSVLFLILAFFNASGLFMLMGAEFLALILIVVYVGAVAVLFLFVVMMLDVDFAELREGFLQYLPIVKRS